LVGVGNLVLLWFFSLDHLLDLRMKSSAAISDVKWIAVAVRKIMETMRIFVSRIRRCCLLLPIFLLASFAALAQGTRYVVSVPVANMFSKPSADVDVVSQAIFSTNVEELAEQDGWIKIRTPQDGYTGWVSRADLAELHGNTGYASTGEVAEVEQLRSNLYREADVTSYAPVMTLPFEARLQVVQEKPGGRWLKVDLPDQRVAWVQQGDVALSMNGGADLQPHMTIPQMVDFSHRFLGLPYTWGGSSSFGYDCSGFVQMLMRQRGYLIPRDADVQAAWSGFEPVKVSKLRAGDVLFFGGHGKITHTGMFIGHGKFIQATTHDHPVIQISPLDAYWRKLLVVERRVKP
jgi:cell wall-associated NlpC family hydrolase